MLRSFSRPASLGVFQDPFEYLPSDSTPIPIGFKSGPMFSSQRSFEIDQSLLGTDQNFGAHNIELGCAAVSVRSSMEFENVCTDPGGL